MFQHSGLNEIIHVRLMKDGMTVCGRIHWILEE